MSMHRDPCVIVWVNTRSILALFGDWKRRVANIRLPSLQAAVDEKGNRFEIPEDAEVVSVNADWARKQIGVMVSHPSFPQVPDGAMLPEVYLRETTVHILKVLHREPAADGVDEFLTVER